MMQQYQSPFLKWPGGKRWFVKQYGGCFPKTSGTYIEPFVGSGAVFFSQTPRRAILGDINEELINLYTIMRDDPVTLKRILVSHQQLHDKEYYYQMRDMIPATNEEKAARMLYLNRTCFNGMYRVNQQGKFNVPIGTKNHFLYDIDLFEEYAKCLQHAQLICSDFCHTIELAGKDDFIFADPPYALAKNTNFIKYNDKLFCWEDQLRLKRALIAARDRGASILMTNVFCEEIMQLYNQDGFYIQEISRPSTIAGKADKRGRVTELVITSDSNFLCH